MKRWSAVGWVAAVVGGTLAGCEERPAAKAGVSGEANTVELKPPPDGGGHSAPLDAATAEARVRQMVAELERAGGKLNTPASQPSAVQWGQPPTPAAEVPVPAQPQLVAPAPTPAPVAVVPAPNVAMTVPKAVAFDPPARDDLAGRLAARAAKDPRDVSAQLDLALLAYLQEQAAPDAAKIAALPAEDREIVSAVIDALVNLRAGVRTDPNATLQSRVRPLAELSDRLRTRSDLAVTALAMTSDVKSFGVYEPMPQVISPRGETPTVVYLEVANFTSRLNERRMWETRLNTDYTLYNSTGRAVWSARPVQTTDLCRNRRQDFFVPSLVRIPPQPPGRYTLKASVTDVNVGRVAESVLPLESK